MEKLQITFAAARVNAGMTQDDVEKRLQVSKQTIINWEKGRILEERQDLIIKKLIRKYKVGHTDFVGLIAKARAYYRNETDIMFPPLKEEREKNRFEMRTTGSRSTSTVCLSTRKLPIQKQLDKAEIGELREYIDLVMKNIGKYNQKVNNMSIKARVTRYQALEAQIDAILRELYAVDYEADAGKMMSEIYTDTYHRIWYDSDRYLGFHAEFAQTDARTVEELIKYPFNGANFSDRIWKQKNHLQSQLMESLTTMMIQSTAPQNIAKDFAKKIRVKKFDAYRLLHTESSFVMSEAIHAGYKEDGVEQHQISATLDSKICGICGRLDRKIYPVSKAVAGKNMPPFHPFCRCTDVSYYPDTPTEGQMRAVRDADGNNIEAEDS